MSSPRTHAKPALLTGRPRVQTQWVWGPYEKRRWAIFAAKLGIFLALPWIPIGGAPALLFDIPARRYHAFGQVFWPQDFYMLGLTLAVFAVLLFATTALVGRVFCGHACPHTLLTSLFMLVDHLVEGDRPARIKLDAGLGTPAQKARRVAKHGAWLAISLGLGFTFVSYFVGAHELLRRTLAGELGGAPLAGIAFIAGLSYLFAGHLRDWICTTVCPYGRFQGAMQDDASLIVTYDAVRGEPRGKGKEQVAKGGCVDCGACVTACPMGIDIRQGPQYECITCSRCIDACNHTMDKIGAAPDLIRYASLQTWQERVENPEAPWPVPRDNRWWRPRLGWYAVVLAALVGAIAVLVTNRPLLALDVARDRLTAFRLPDGRVSNLYALKLLNKDTVARVVHLDLEGLDGQLVVGENPITLAPGEIRSLRASVLIPASSELRPLPFRFRLIERSTRAVKDLAPATFVVPSGPVGPSSRPTHPPGQG